MYTHTISVHASQRTQFASIKKDEFTNAAQENNGCLSCESYGTYAMRRQNADYLVLNLSCVQSLGQHRTEWDISELQTVFFIVELLAIERTTLYCTCTATDDAARSALLSAAKGTMRYRFRNG